MIGTMGCRLSLQRCTRNSGFSVIEVLVAIAILGVAILALVAMYTRGMIMLGHSKQVSAATDAAQACLENVKAKGSGFVALGSFDGRVGDPTQDGFPPAPYPRTEHNYPLVVRATRTGAPAGTISIAVDVHYDDQNRVTLATYLSE